MAGLTCRGWSKSLSLLMAASKVCFCTPYRSSMRLYKAVLINFFGHGAQRPWRATWVRLGLVGLFAIGMGHVATVLIGPIYLVIPAYIAFWLVIIAVQVTVGGVFLCALGLLRADNRDAIDRL